jgi:O-antigen/teichoic acid export membrane protein
MHQTSSANVGHRVLRGVSWLFVGMIISRALGMIATLVVARVLGKERFGQLGMTQSTISAFLVFAEFGLGVTATKFVAEYRTTQPLRAGRIIGLSMAFAIATGAVMGLVLWTASPWLCARTLAAPELTPIIQTTSLLVMLGAINGAQNGILGGFEAFRVLALNSFLVGLLQFPIMVFGVLTGGLSGAVWALVGGAVLQFLVNHRAIRLEARRIGISVKFKGWRTEIPILWQFSLPAMLSAVVVMPVNWMCNVLLVNQTSGYAEMGIYTAASSLQNAFLSAISTVGTPLLSVLANLSGTHSQSVRRFNMLVTWALGIGFTLPLICFPEIPQQLYGAQYAGLSFVQAFVLIMLFLCIICYKQGLARVLVLKNLMWWGVLSNGVWAAVLLVSAYFLTRKGAAGLALSYVIAYGVSTIIFVPFYARIGLVPLNTMVSAKAGVLWGISLCGVLLAIYNTPLGWRIAFFLVSLYFVLTTLQRLSPELDTLVRKELASLLLRFSARLSSHP